MSQDPPHPYSPSKGQSSHRLREPKCPVEAMTGFSASFLGASSPFLFRRCYSLPSVRSRSLPSVCSCIGMGNSCALLLA